MVQGPTRCLPPHLEPTIWKLYFIAPAAMKLVRGARVWRAWQGRIMYSCTWYTWLISETSDGVLAYL